MPAKTPTPVVLPGRHVTLEPLTSEHIPDLFVAGGRDEEIWRWLTATTPQTPEELAAIVEARLAEVATGRRVAFSVIDQAAGRAVGTTNLHGWSEVNESVEIGGTWYARSAWRTAVNTESKLLLLTHAFEVLGMGRIVWRTDVMNARAQAALDRLGAQREGVHRRVQRTQDGKWRDLVCFSLLADEWPQVKVRLTTRLARG